MNPQQMNPDEADAHLSALLDEALDARNIPGGVPEDLSSRICARTLSRLPGRRDVAGRIGPFAGGSWVAATAAVVALAIGAAIWVGSSQDPPASAPGLAVDSQSIEAELDLLALEIDSLNGTSTWQTLHDSLDRDLAEWELADTDMVTQF